MPLNIDWQQILLHLFNFIVLFAILYFLLYKPVKQFMDKRTQYYKDLEDKANANLAESEKVKAQYAEKLSGADAEIMHNKETARKELDASLANMKKQAEDEAAKIVAEAHQTVDREHAKMLKEVQSEISDMVTTATEKIVLQSSTSESYEQFLSAVERGGENE